ncbi:MAG: hypothetical protein AAFZ38_07110 [Myxococcota bacterium]
MRSSTLAFFVFAMLGCSNALFDREDARGTSGSEASLNASTTSYRAEKGRLRRRMDFERRRSVEQPASAVVLSRVAGLELEWARLTGEYDAYDRAEVAVTRAFAIAEGQSGPYLTRAQLRFALHDLDGALSDLAHAKSSTLGGSRASSLALRGSIHCHAGRYAEARKDLESAVDLDATPRTLSALALLEWKSGRFEAAEVLYRRAASSYHGREAQPRAWSHLVLGLLDLDRGRLDEALVHYQEADAEMKGWWLVQEHIAEVRTQRGELETAEALYRGVVEETQSPELMAAYADVLELRRRTSDAESWRARAQAEFDRRLARWPSATSGHALDFLLEHSTPSRALELAQANHRLRPGGDASVGLARAYLFSDDVRLAREVIDSVRDTPYRSAELFAVAADIYQADGDSEAAAEARSRALKIDPTVAE